jgi:hypothetical protein
MREELVLGTTNAGKVRELAALLEPHGIRVISLRECPGAVSVDETGTTFAANADLKASQQASALSRWVLAEDSGLCVDALGGAPGIHSARFSLNFYKRSERYPVYRINSIPYFLAKHSWRISNTKFFNSHPKFFSYNKMPKLMNNHKGNQAQKPKTLAIFQKLNLLNL